MATRSRRPDPDFTSREYVSQHTEASTVTAEALTKNGWKALPKEIFSSFGKCWENCIMFQSNGTTLFNPSAIHSTRLTALVNDLENRDDLIRNGITLQESHFNIHQFHPTMSLWWGRIVINKDSRDSIKKGPLPHTGLAICKVSLPTDVDIMDLYVLITYKLPTTSAFAVNRLKAFKQMLESIIEG
jgi:hypothetical protein